MDALHASDTFLSEGRVPAMRCHGSITQFTDIPELTRKDFTDFIAETMPKGTLDRLEAEKDLDIGIHLDNDTVPGGRFRVNLSFQRGLMSMAIRRIPSGDLNPDVLRIPQSAIKMADNMNGLILVTGATGCGKSTTLACLLNHINKTANKHIVTIEDPIEFTHSDNMSVVSQREIGSDTSTFASALKHVVRQNPDVIFIGEIRDRETIETAISAAMTGHLVAATIHTVDVQQTIERIINFFPEGLQEQIALDLSYVLRGIVSQKLLPAKGSMGRIPAFEILLNTPLVQRLIATHNLTALPEIIKAGEMEGMISFSRSILNLYKAGDVTLETAAAFAPNKEEFMLLVQGMETGIDTLRTYSADPDHGLSIKKLLLNAVDYKSSDLLLTTGAAPSLRIDGLLQAFDMPVLTPSDTKKLLYSVLNASQRADFEERKEIDFALAVKGLASNTSKKELQKDYRFRVNGYYQKGSVAAAFRVIPNTIPDPATLGIPPAVLRLTKRNQGLVLVTGPTGSGKSTTLAALINIINHSRPCHIITIEDPIEFVHTHQMAIIDQREVHADTNSFANALKYVLRQDPDVILVGEMRDPETISTVLTAAETGHLVFATLHTNDVTQTIDRIIDVFPPERQNQVRSQLAACLECVVAQRLLPKKTPPDQPSEGRIAVFEVLMGTTAVKAMIRDKKTHQLLGAMETASKDGMITMEHALRDLYNKGLISKDTLLNMLPRTSGLVNQQ